MKPVDVAGRLKRAIERDLPATALTDFQWASDLLAPAGVPVNLAVLLALEASLSGGPVPPSMLVWLRLLDAVTETSLYRLREALALALDTRQFASDARWAQPGAAAPAAAEAVEALYREARFVKLLAAEVAGRIRRATVAKR